jgi:hypothetical protein
MRMPTSPDDDETATGPGEFHRTAWVQERLRSQHVGGQAKQAIRQVDVWSKDFHPTANTSFGVRSDLAMGVPENIRNDGDWAAIWELGIDSDVASM